eukprot:CAMPEP_0114239520 /NCGR_PEP_ID=MMETSP0058-20121206/8514_1 /TAXON_ID=36894 /ORGANISM="Pyramimonas parkeae, CCMP726" /LENGTH=472 /DNA_ID=CAMNT_0001351727 /DNA_START=47 /DNA_END=1465 /DNA_ORIENTATION=+
MTRSAGLLHKVGNAVLDLPDRDVGRRLPKRLIAVDDAIGLCSPALQGVLSSTAAAIRMLNKGHRRKSEGGLQIAHIHLGNALLNKVPELKDYQVYSPEEEEDCMGLLGVGRSRGLDAVRQLHQIVQAMDLWEEHSEGLKQCGLMHLPEDLRRDLRVTKRVDKSAIRMVHKEVKHMLHALVKDRVVLMVPSTPGPAPLISTQWAELRAWNATCLRINSIAGIAGLPQVTIPITIPDVDGPMGMSFIAGPGEDELLLDLALLLSTRIHSCITQFSRPPSQKIQASSFTSDSDDAQLSTRSTLENLNAASCSPRLQPHVSTARALFGDSEEKVELTGELGSTTRLPSMPCNAASQSVLSEYGETDFYDSEPLDAVTSHVEVTRWVLMTITIILFRQVWHSAGQLAVFLKQARVQLLGQVGSGVASESSSLELEECRTGLLLSTWVARELFRRYVPFAVIAGVSMGVRALLLLGSS